MSTFFGIYNRNDKPVEMEIFNRMQSAMSYWEPDESGRWHEGPVALGHEMLWNTPESKLEHLPAEQDECVITMDGRLDNRDELVQQLGKTQRPLQQITDSTLILAAYQKWGKECPKYLLGDFAFVIWDRRNQQLFCVRDHVGVKQFFYYMTESLFVFTNDLKGTLEHPDVSRKICDESVANFIVNTQLISPTLTFFKEIQKLPPAHSLTISKSKVDKTCYWRAEDAPRLKLGNEEDYSRMLRELLEQAVYDRMRSSYPITSHLSGGLDSSSIAVIAARKLREKNETLLAFNWLHEPTEDDDPSHYEWANSKTIAEAEDIDHHYVAISAEDLYRCMKTHDIAYGESARFWYEYPVRDAVQEKGSRTILTGWGGDELASYHGQSYYADLFFRGKICKALKELQLRAWQQKEKRFKRMLSGMYHKIFLIFVPRQLYCYMPKNRCMRNVSFPFVTKEFLPMVLQESKKTPVLTMQPQITIREHMLAYWQNGHIQSRIESWATAALPNRLEYSYPLLDKRIIEFVLGVPADCFVKRRITRHLFRSAVQDLIPEKIVWSNAKIEPRRVAHLLEISLKACKLFVEKDKIGPKQTDYVDNGNVQKTLVDAILDSMILDQYTTNKAVSINTAISIIQSKLF